jgi:hypothetical protein
MLPDRGNLRQNRANFPRAKRSNTLFASLKAFPQQQGKSPAVAPRQQIASSPTRAKRSPKGFGNRLHLKSPILNVKSNK